MAELAVERLVLASSRLPLMRDSGYKVWRWGGLGVGGWGGVLAEAASCIYVNRNVICSSELGGNQRVLYLLRLAAGGGAEGVRRVVVAVEPTVQLLRRGGKVIQSHLLPGDAPAALGVHAVPAALLVT